jgi:O-antigen/teichoic acid export membrane protein
VSGFRRASAEVLLGSGAGFVVALLLTPFISRIYGPISFGLFATVIATVSVFLGFSTLRLEVFAQRAPRDIDAAQLLVLGLLVSCICGILMTMVGVVAVCYGASPWWATAGILLWTGSLQSLGSGKLSRLGLYKPLAKMNFVQAAGTAALQLALGVFSPSVWALLAGFGGGRIPWLLIIRLHTFKRAELRSAWQRTRRAALVAGSSAIVNSLASQLAILLGSWLFGAAQVGMMAMSTRILVGPLSIVGAAAASANLGEAGRLLRTADPGLGRLVRRAITDLLVVGIVPCGLAALLGTRLVPWLLGEQWREAGVIVALLSVGALAQFAMSPFSQLLNLTGHSRQLFAWDCLRLTLILLSFAIPALLSQSFTVAVGAYSLVQVVIYAVLCRLVILAVRSPDPR